jgi:deoxyhypusine synthase
LVKPRVPLNRWSNHESAKEMASVPVAAADAVLVKSVDMPEDSIKIEGYDFNKGVDHNALLDSFLCTGFQASNFGMAVEEINKMRAWSLNDEPVAEDEDDELKDEESRKKVKTTVFLGYTSNMASCGVRETIRYLCQHKMVDVIVATAGGIEEDFIKCLAPTYLGSGNSLHPNVASGFDLDGRTLRLQVSGCLFKIMCPPVPKYALTRGSGDAAAGPQPHRKHDRSQQKLRPFRGVADANP